MRHLLALLIPILGACTAQAATLAPDSLLCESEQEILIPIREKWNSTTGSGAMKTLDVAMRFSRSVTSPGQSIKVAAYERMIASCSPSGNEALSVSVVEQRPISGVTRVRMTFRGAEVELWAYRQAVTE